MMTQYPWVAHSSPVPQVHARTLGVNLGSLCPSPQLF